jgi:hypothetical protein
MSLQKPERAGNVKRVGMLVCVCTVLYRYFDPFQLGTAMKPILAALIVIAFATPSFAALSGFYDSAEKIDAIFANPEIGNALRQAPIGSISEIGKDKDGASLWMLRVQDCDLTVRVIATKPKGVGKVTYRAEPKGTCE